MGKSEMLFEEEKIALFAVGSMVKTAVEVREALKEKGISCTVVNARFVKPSMRIWFDTLQRTTT